MQASLTLIIIILTGLIATSAITAFILMYSDSRKSGMNDRPRKIIMYSFILEAAAVCLKIAQIIHDPVTSLDYKLLDLPYMTLILLFQGIFFLYPIDILKPGWLNINRALLLALPFLIVMALYFALDFEPLNLYSNYDVLANIESADVMYRIFALILLVCYSIIPTILNFRMKEISVKTIGLFMYTMNLVFLTLLITFYMITAIPYFYIVYLIVSICSNVFIIYYEIRLRNNDTLEKYVKNHGEERLQLETENKNEITSEPKWKHVETKKIDLVYEDIRYQFEEKEIWKYPNLDINSLAKEIGSNKTYIQKCIKTNSGYNFTEFVNRYRIRYVVSELDNHSKESLKTLFNRAGFTSRTTSWRNFKAITGMTPTEYIRQSR